MLPIWETLSCDCDVMLPIWSTLPNWVGMFLNVMIIKCFNKYNKIHFHTTTKMLIITHLSQLKVTNSIVALQAILFINDHTYHHEMSVHTRVFQNNSLTCFTSGVLLCRLNVMNRLTNYMYLISQWVNNPSPDHYCLS